MSLSCIANVDGAIGVVRFTPPYGWKPILSIMSLSVCTGLQNVSIEVKRSLEFRRLILFDLFSTDSSVSHFHLTPGQARRSSTNFC